MDYTPKFSAEISSDFVAEWTKASDHPRSFGQNMGWVRGQKFFFIFSKFDIRSNFVFSLFFKPYGTFSMIYMAIFFKMAPLNGYEPTVLFFT